MLPVLACGFAGVDLAADFAVAFAAGLDVSPLRIVPHGSEGVVWSGMLPREFL